MNISIFRRKTEWIVLTDRYELTLHEDLASAMNYASAEIRTADNLGATTQNHQALYDR